MARAISDAPVKRERIGHPALTTWIRRIVFYALLLIAWQLFANTGIIPTYNLPGPADVVASLGNLFQSGQLLPAIGATMMRLAIGYAISLAIGLVLGLLIGCFRIVEETVGSLVLGLQALPSVCWLPLGILWFGLSDQAIIFVVAMGAIFSITLGVNEGIKNTPPVYLKAARNLGARGLALAAQVILPAALPAIFSGLKQGWTFAWRSLMAGELIYFTRSLGNLLQQGRDNLDPAQVMAVMVVIIAISVIIENVVFGPIERRMRERRGLGSQRS
ncbi:MAG TPA: ABC transporter permease [Ktedonobacteraceae bacterium]|nr:ABC transporter permease [Ktedonobacteraceae bacterium]